MYANEMMDKVLNKQSYVYVLKLLSNNKEKMLNDDTKISDLIKISENQKALINQHEIGRAHV